MRKHFTAALLVLWAFSAVLAQSPFNLRSLNRMTNGEVMFSAALPSNVNYRIESSVTLEGLTNATSWHGLITVPPGPRTLQHTDTAAPFLSQRFYRAQQLTGVTNLTGDHVITTNGEVIIHPVNHASLVLQWRDITIYVDPVGSATLYATFPRPNLILVTHSHSDHYSSSTLGGVRSGTTIILAPQAVYSAMDATLKSLTGILTNGASTNVAGIQVDAIKAYNSNHPLGSGNGYVATLGGRRFLFSGDTGDIPDLHALADIEVAFLCMNLPFTMSITNAAAVIRDMRPRVVYPYHYRNQDNSYSDLNDFKRRVGQDLGIEVRIRQWY